MIEGLKKLQMLTDEQAYFTRDSGDHLIMVAELTFPEYERLVRYVAQSHEVEQGSEQLAPHPQIEVRVIPLTPNQRC